MLAPRHGFGRFHYPVGSCLTEWLLLTHPLRSSNTPINFSGMSYLIPFENTLRAQPRALIFRWWHFCLAFALLLTAPGARAQTYIIGANQTACAGTIYDSGGATGDYGDDEDLTTVLTPATAGAKVVLTFSTFNLEATYDFLRIYDGPTASAPLLGAFTGSNSPGIINASAANTTGQLTLVFTSDLSISYAGFEATVACATAVPNITSFTPATGLPGTSVVITGTGFTGATSVEFNGIPATSFVVNSPTQITAVVPAGASTGRIRVMSTAVGISSTNFTVPAPTITSFTPATGLPGTSVVITGIVFTGTTDVSFNGIPATSFVVNSPTQITAVVPVGASTGRIQVTSTAVATSSTDFVVPAPTVTSFTPTSGPEGTVVVVTGTNFSGVSAVTVGGAGGASVSNFTVNSLTQLTLALPLNAPAGTICVTTPAGTSCSSATFATGTPTYVVGTNITACSGVLYDSGGANGSYTNNESLTTVITPATAGAKAQLTFTAFDLESNFDYVRIYDGPSSSSPPLGVFSGNANPGTVSASITNSTGQLTVVFTSDGSTTRAGFAAGVSCLSCFPVTNLTVTNVTTTTAVLTFTPGLGNNSYVVTYTPDNGVARTTTASASPFTLTGLNPATPYTVSVQPVCTTGTSANVTTSATFTTLLPNDEPCGALPIGPVAISTTNIGSSTSLQGGINTPTCGGGPIPKDVWFTFVASATSSTLTLTGNAAGTVRLYTTASCTAGPFTEVFCRGSGTSNTTVGTVALPNLTVGTHYYVAVNGFGSSDAPGSFTIAATNVLATKAQANTEALVVYPNPSSTGQLTLKLSGLHGAGQATLLNSLGQAVLTQALANASAEQSLITAKLATGIYTLRVAVDGQVLIRKVVLQ
jgi:hypothetical protein